MARHAYVKLGGALLTDKERLETHRPDELRRLAAELAAFAETSALPLIVGHGSGSYAHMAARDAGFLARPTALATSLVAASARRLDVLVVDALIAAGLPAMPLPAATFTRSENGALVGVNAAPVAAMLSAGIVPVIYGDTAPDSVRGGTIVSTEPIIAALAGHLPAARIVLATDVDGVYPADPHIDPNAVPYAVLTPDDVDNIQAMLSGARPDATDVTGGMASKVTRMAALVRTQPDLTVRIVSGLRPGAVRAALAGDPAAGGTLIRSRQD